MLGDFINIQDMLFLALPEEALNVALPCTRSIKYFLCEQEWQVDATGFDSLVGRAVRHL